MLSLDYREGVIRKKRMLSEIARLLLISLAFTQTNAQTLEIAPSEADTIHVLNGRLGVVLKSKSFEVIKADSLRQMYSSSFNVGKILCADGFRIENSTLRFYQTSIENNEVSDGGLSTWKLIASFTDKIPQNHWMESGWERMRNGTVTYFVKLVSLEKPQQYYKFVFYYIDKKLSFSLYQCPVYFTEIYPSNPDKFPGFAAHEIHLSKFRILEK